MLYRSSTGSLPSTAQPLLTWDNFVPNHGRVPISETTTQGYASFSRSKRRILLRRRLLYALLVDSVVRK